MEGREREHKREENENIEQVEREDFGRDQTSVLAEREHYSYRQEYGFLLPRMKARLSLEVKRFNPLQVLTDWGYNKIRDKSERIFVLQCKTFFTTHCISSDYSVFIYQVNVKRKHSNIQYISVY